MSCNPITRARCAVAIVSAALVLGGCDFEGTVYGSRDDVTVQGDGTGRRTPQSATPGHCRTLDFDTDSAGQPIAAGRVLTETYEDLGICISARADGQGRGHGLPVAFDSNHPSGDDLDLSFENLGNLLISQECPTAAEIAAGTVQDPDDNAAGAVFEFTFEKPVCIPGVTLLDIDEDEEPVRIKFYDASGALALKYDVPPTGDNERIDVMLPELKECDVVRATFTLSGSGALDNVEVCDSIVAGEVVFQDVVSAPGSQRGVGIATDFDGNAYAAISLDTEIGVRRYSPAGVPSALATVAPGTAADIAVFGDGSVVVFGNDPAGRLYLAVLDRTGAIIRQPSLVALGVATPVAVATDGADIVFAANIRGDVVVGKVDPTNNTELSQPFDSGGVDFGAGLAIDRHGNIAVAVTGSGAFVQTFDSALNKHPVIPLSGFLGPFGFTTGVAYNSAGNLFVSGDIAELPTRTVVLALDPDGSLFDMADFVGESDDDRSSGIAVDSYDNVIVAGSVVNAQGNFDGWVRKLDANLDRLFPRQIDLAGSNDLVNDVTTDSKGNILAVGETDGDGIDVLTVKISP